MANIVIAMKDGTERRFPHVGRPGGSYTKTIRYEGGFAIVTDEWYNETAIPQSDINEVKVSHTNC
jgi:hypothetical protein